MPRRSYSAGRFNRRRRRSRSPGSSVDFDHGAWTNRRAASRRRLNELRRNLYSNWPTPYTGGNSGRYGNTRIFRYTGASNNNDAGASSSQEGSAPAPDAKTLTVKSVDFKVKTNGPAHHTDQYEISAVRWDNPKPKLVVRRGQPFNIEIDFSKPYDAAVDDLKLVFEAGDKPLASKKTQASFALSSKDKANKWGAKIVTQQGNLLTVCVFTPPDCFVGQWDFSIDVVKKDDKSVSLYRYDHEDPVYIIFNPWCKDDPVFLDDPELLKEYVLNKTGKIYSGSKNSITSKPWNFGQFESDVLDCALYLLEISGMKWAVRGNPILVVRKLSAMVNSQDDGGVLVGNWSGDYSGGRSPLTWTGSAAILEQYMLTKEPVSYGQCWVFSGVSTTLCRALGIPARSVTNFASAHDTDGSVTIDIHYGKDGERDDNLNDDSVWNFHVWNEAWMSRPDLPVGFGGWQAFDATPQEASDGVYCCGPMSVQAIKQGDITLPYDGPFIFAEVNADRMHWYPDVTGNLECIYVDKKSVGKSISTKAPNDSSREDVTNNYKPLEGTPEERAAVLKANLTGSNRRDLYFDYVEEVEFSLVQDEANTWVGEDFVVVLKAKNTAKEKRTVNGRMVLKSMYYTGVCADKLKSEPFKLELKPGEEKEVKLTVTEKEYHCKLKDGCMVDLAVWAMVEGTKQHFTAKEDYRMRKPHLTIKAPKDVKAEEEFKVELSFTNPLDTPLTECYVAVDGLAKALNFPQGNVAAKGTFHATVPITPKMLGQTELIVNFNAKQLEDVNGSHPIFIRGL